MDSSALNSAAAEAREAATPASFEASRAMRRALCGTEPVAALPAGRRTLRAR
jgi:hypothetical protein